MSKLSKAIKALEEAADALEDESKRIDDFDDRLDGAVKLLSIHGAAIENKDERIKNLEARVAALENLDRIIIDQPVFPKSVKRSFLASDIVSYYTVGNFQSAIVGKDGHVFWCFVGRAVEWPYEGHTPENVHFPWIDQVNDEDPRLKLVVGHKHPSGNIFYRVVKTGVILSPGHCAPSIGIDSNGFLHLAGDMIDSVLSAQSPEDPTSTDWIYYRSTEPLDINDWDVIGGSTVNGGLPHSLITYPMFHSGGDELFCSYKFRLGSYGAEPTAAGMARWEGDHWKTIGGNNITPPPATTGHIWDENDLVDVFCVSRGGASSGGTAPNQYGHYKQTLFTTGSRLHVATQVIGNKDLGFTQEPLAGQAVIYAYSDDRGATWKRANGSVIHTLPMTIDHNTTGSGGGLMTIENSGVVAMMNSNDTAGRKSALSFDPETGFPVATYSFGTVGHGVKRWTGAEWEETEEQGGYKHPSGFYVRINRYKLEAYDGGQWKSIGDVDYPSNNRKVDWQSLMETGILLTQDQHIVRSSTKPIIDQTLPAQVSAISFSF